LIPLIVSGSSFQVFGFGAFNSKSAGISASGMWKLVIPLASHSKAMTPGCKKNGTSLKGPKNWGYVTRRWLFSIMENHQF
jgi:hypothetical protein